MISFDRPCRGIRKHRNTLWKTDGRSMQQSRLHMNMQALWHFISFKISNVKYVKQADPQSSHVCFGCFCVIWDVGLGWVFLVLVDHSSMKCKRHFVRDQVLTFLFVDFSSHLHLGCSECGHLAWHHFNSSKNTQLITDIVNCSQRISEIRECL